MDTTNLFAIKKKTLFKKESLALAQTRYVDIFIM